MQNYVYVFEGICIGIIGKNLSDLNASLVLRNVVLGVGLELVIGYYVNRVYSLQILDYKRKKFVYNRAKLYYIRTRINQASRIV